MVVEAMLMLLTSGKDDHAEQADVCEPQLHAWCVFVCCIFDILSTSEKERIYNIIVRIYAMSIPHGWTLNITGVQEPSLLTLVVVSLGFELPITR